jgi:long-chain acyl-CoA synthetase
MRKGIKHEKAAPFFDKLVFSKVQLGISIFFSNPSDSTGNINTAVTVHCCYNSVLIFKVKERLGGKLRVIVSGGAPLAVPVEEFLRVVTCAYVIQGYGMHLSVSLLSS